MISLLTNIVLDATVGVAWWFTKNSYYGIKNGVNYLFFYTEDNSTKEHILHEDNEPTHILMSDFHLLMTEKNNKIITLEEKIKFLEQ